MANTIISPNMLLPVPVVGQDPGPQFATDINNCLSILDQHNHSVGSGNQITPGGMNISSDLAFRNNNATALRSTRYSSQSAVLSAATDLSCIYAVNGDLYYNDGSANQVRITQSGAVAGTPGSIGSLVSPASASYSAGAQTFIFQSAANTPATLDGASLRIRNPTVANSKALTLSAPAAMGADFGIVLPNLPAAQAIITMDAAGNQAALVPDGTTVAIVGSTVSAVQSGLGFPGFINMYGGTLASIPSGWLPCDGTSYLRTAYPALFTALGTAHGAADGTHFNVPDMRGAFPRGTDESPLGVGPAYDPDRFSRTAPRTGANTSRAVGSLQLGGVKATDLGISDPGHRHVLILTSTPVGGTSGANLFPAVGSTNSNFDATATQGSATTTTGITLTSSTSAADTRPVNVYLTFIIKT